MAIVGNRDLRFAPSWPCSEAVVVFDAVSGDYWLLTPVAGAVLRELRAGPQVTTDLMHTALRSRVRSEAYLREVLDGLVDTGLLAA